MKKLFTSLILLLCLINIGFVSELYGQAPATLPYSQDFTAGNDLTILNGTQPNKWVHGNLVGNPGNSLFISEDDGVSNTYDNSTSNVVFAYRDITIPTGSVIGNFSFDWKANGEATYDYLRVWLVPTTYTLTPGTRITTGTGRVQVSGGDFNLKSTWQTYSANNLNVTSFAGNTMRLVFEWRNDGSQGSNPPAAIDNISFSLPSCLFPVNLTVPTVGANSAGVSWAPQGTPPANGYEYYYTTTNTPPDNATPGTPVTGTTTTIPGLAMGVTYYWWVRSVCSPTDKSSWAAGPSFTIGQIGQGTATGALPVQTSWGYSYSQQIYTAAEITAAGTSSYITAIKFFVSSASTPQANYNNWTVYMGNTAQNNFSSTTNWVSLPNLRQVFTGTIPNLVDGEWVTVQLTTPFVWDGTSNIVIAVDENAPDFAGTTAWGQYAAGTNRGIMYYSDSTNPDPATPPTASSRYSSIPRLLLVSEALQPCSTAPPSNIAVNSITPTSANVTWTPTTGATYLLQYRVVGTGTWNQVPINTPLTSSWPLAGLTEMTQYEVQIATICGGSQGAFSASTLFTTPQITYCSAASTSSTNDGFISKVVVTPAAGIPITSTSDFSNYTDYTTDPARLITLARGVNNNTVSISKSWPQGGTQYSFGTGVWIDFNRNGVFEPSEKVLTSASNTTTPVNATFYVPTVAEGAYGGALTTRMRVALRESGAPDACGTFTWGEVEDYAVKLVDLPACTNAAPTNITVTNVTANTATVYWPAVANATYTIRWKLATAGTYTIPPVTLAAGVNNYTITGLLEQTKYDVQVSAKCGTGAAGAYSTAVQFTTTPLAYCDMTGTGTNDHISNVTVTSVNPGVPVMSNNSVQTNYISYTTPETLITLDAGSNNNKISVSKGWTGATSSDAVTAWIDFNRNGTFETGERILISPSNTNTPVTATFSVPSGAYVGPYTTTMRVVLKRGSAPTICQNAANGEVEDYAVRIRPCTSTVPNQPTITPTHNSATITFNGPATTVTYLVRYRTQGPPPGVWQEVYASAVLGNIPLVITGLDNASTYEVQIAAVCGENTSAFTPIKTFTTRCDPTPPNVTVSNITTNSALVTWAPVVASSTYIFEWRKVGDATWQQITGIVPPTNTYQLNGLDPYTTYEVRVANKCNGETSINPYSNPKVFTTERICELPPPGLTITQLTPTSAEVVWEGFPGATYSLRYRKVGIPSWTTVATTNPTYTITGLTELTRYEMQVVNICSGNTPGTYTPPYYFTTPTVIYCQMAAESSAGEHISKVTVTPNGRPKMTNESGASVYTDYTGVPGAFIELVQGSTGNEISIEKKWTGTNHNEGIAVWIDFNRNGTFDIDERVFTSPPNTTTPVTGTFSVPADAFVSTSTHKYVVMRVAMERDGIPVNCVNMKNGEVEDYSVRIAKQGIPNSVNQDDILIYPNPVSTVLYVKNISKRAKYKIYNAAGQLTADGILLNNQINVSKLISGVYVIDIEDNDKTVQKKFIKE
ncbi:MAG: fibronectin type III domain-containing protein [Chryseobacterium sp.]|jgi:hypothetical protein|uniref:GEVED domain-containing protein n=1 Tax=Chryseobacterium sp. TaxID=1871047 RepID=UPI0028284B37|nr:GEVED domain-containing protein [Chryseobacterium sp.]MDR2236730.1 fibronectin type III domain-containing protein [Chryseobacterium sp.]